MKTYPIDKDWEEYPIGTAANASTGGYWIKGKYGWKWPAGSRFPAPGAHAVSVSLPSDIKKKVDLDLTKVSANAFGILGEFKEKALNQGWYEKETLMVIEIATSGDYDHLLRTMMEYCEDKSDD